MRRGRAGHRGPRRRGAGRVRGEDPLQHRLRHPRRGGHAGQGRAITTPRGPLARRPRRRSRHRPHRCHRPARRRARPLHRRPSEGGVLTMALARTRAVALLGVDGALVDVEAAITSGVPGLHLVGLPDAALNEARDRVRAAILNSGEEWPNRHVTVSLFPAGMPKRGSGFDLAIAVALLGPEGAFSPEAWAGMVLIGELGLDGRVRPVAGVLPAVLAAADAGADTVVVPRVNLAEASLVPGVRVIGIRTLRALVARLRDIPPPDDEEAAGEERTPPQPNGLAARSRGRRGDLDLADVRGQAEARKVLEVSAAGGHHLLLTGPPGCGKTMLAERLPT